MALGVISKVEGERVKASVRETSLNFDTKLDVQRKNQLRKLREVMNARKRRKGHQSNHEDYNPSEIPAHETGVTVSTWLIF